MSLFSEKEDKFKREVWLFGNAISWKRENNRKKDRQLVLSEKCQEKNVATCKKRDSRETL